MTTVYFPRKYISLSKTVENMIGDTQGDVIQVPLPSSQETINDVFTIFELYDEQGDLTAIRNKVESYSLDKLVQVTNLLQYLHVPDNVMGVAMGQIAAILTDTLVQLTGSLDAYVHEKSIRILLPYYEPLRKLNPDVEKTIKEKSFNITNMLQWQIQGIWKAIGIQNSKEKSKFERDEFNEGKETIASFLDRNVSAPVLKLIEDNQRKKLEGKLSQGDIPVGQSSNNSFGSDITSLAAAAMAKLRELYNYYVAPAQQ